MTRSTLPLIALLVAAGANGQTASDPEPPDAQARAVAVLNEPSNANKTTSLKMNITTLVDRTSGIAGFGSNIQERKENLEQTLSRLKAKVTETEVTIQLSGAILFDFDSTAIRADAEQALNDVKKVLNAYPGRPARVEGHTDSIASDDYNQKLSEGRAKSVVTWLGAHGVEAKRLKASGLGESKPVATNDTSEGRQRNRRVEIIIARK